MLALSGVDGVATQLLDRAGRIARGLNAEFEMFVCLYEPDIVQSLDSGLIEASIRARVDEERRRLERVADQLRE